MKTIIIKYFENGMFHTINCEYNDNLNPDKLSRYIPRILEENNINEKSITFITVL